MGLQEQDVECLSFVPKHFGPGDSRLGNHLISDSEDLFPHLGLLEKAIKATVTRRDPPTTLKLGRVAMRLMRGIDLVMLEDGSTAEQTQLLRRLPLLIARELLMQTHDAWDCVRALEAGKEAGSRYGPRTLSSFWKRPATVGVKANEVNARLRHPTTRWDDPNWEEMSAEDEFQQSSADLLNAVREFAKTNEMIFGHASFEDECR